ncbi:MAG: oxidoreductase domain protein [Pedosphaera sp.]|nr:oxidoreductase domain protein [Pedosphaera sp.]
MSNINRRRFLKASLLTAGSVGLLPGAAGLLVQKAAAQNNIHSQILGANDDIRVAVVGINGRGADHIKSWNSIKGVRLVALCDVDSAVLQKGIKQLKDNNQDVAGYQDIRQLLENKDIDAISIATPNHWHSLAAIWGVQAGKDVYVEKPVSHNLWEGRQLVNAARKHKRIVQAGTQSRSNPGMRQAIAWLQDGGLGRIIRARGLCYKRRKSIGKTSGPQPVPESVNYDLWLGPAPMEQPRRERFHYDWHWFWQTGNGDVGNQGIHQMDIARWALGETELSPRVFSFGGRLGYDDDGTTPNTQIVYHDYKKAPLIFEVRGLPAKPDADTMDSYRGASIGVVVDCEYGYMVLPNYSEATVYDSRDRKVREFKGEASHFENFIQAVRSRKSEDLNADILEGHLSSALVHTANISYRLGKQESPAQMHEEIKGNPAALECLTRMQEHLSANNVALAKSPATFGAFLKFNPKTERFTNNKKANELLTREYREPFVVQEKI